MNKKKKGFKDLYIIITDSIILILDPDHKVKNAAKLLAWTTLPSLGEIKRNLDNPDIVNFVWRKVNEKDPWSLTVIMQNSQECLNQIMRNLKLMGFSVNKNYEKKRRIQE